MTEDKNNQFVEFLCSLLNQYVFQEAKNHIADLKLYYQTNPATSGNKLCQELLGAIESYDLAAIDMPLFNSILARTGKSGAEGQELLSKIIEYKKYSKDQVQPTLKYLKDLVASGLIRKANSLYATSPSDYIKFLKQSEVKVGDEDYLASTSVNRLDINTLLAQNQNDFIESSMPWLNKTFQPECAIEKGQLIGISMPPGRGKSMMAMNEALYMALHGHKVLYLAMGDLNVKDFIVRMSAIYTGLSYGEVKRNLLNSFQSLSRATGDRLNLCICPAAKITVDEWIDYCKTRDDEVIFIDYDSNFKSNAAENMYSEYGEIYEKLTELTAANKLVYILCQPKVNVWNNEAIQLSELGESSRKQHTLDIAITRGAVVDCPLNLGIITVAKSRRGKVGTRVYSILLNNGRFKDIPSGVYTDLMKITEDKEFTEAEIDAMVESYEKNKASIERQLSSMQQGSQQQSFKGPRPF